MARLIILDTAAVDTPARLATSANATPWFFTNPIAINARTQETSLRRLPDLGSLIEINAPSADDADYTKLHSPSTTGA
jgi:hypothetical protein